MATMPQQPAEDAPVPFFEDTRTISQKLGTAVSEWRPTQPEHDCPPIVFGLVIDRGEYVSKYRDQDGNYKTHDTARVLTSDGIVWSIVALHGYLQSEFNRKRPEVGDWVAVAYQGTKPGKPGESDPHVYQVEVERNPDRPALVEVDDKGSGSPPESDLPPVTAYDETEGGFDDDEAPY